MNLKTYYMLTKPGIILGNVATTAAGFALASKGDIDFALFPVTLLGLSLVIACAGALNNCIDRAADAKMSRTKDRALVKGTIPLAAAIFFGAFLGSIGIAILALYVNALTASIAILGLFVYLVLYAFIKYRSFYGTLVGSVAGAVPPVVGYCAVSDRLDLAAFLLFMITVFWQMPHFFSIAIYRLNDYVAASIPVLPATNGIDSTKKQMVAYIIAFIVASLLLTAAGYTGYIYGWIAAVLGFAWLGFCIAGLNKKSTENAAWARQMFFCSLAVIMGICLAIPLDIVL